MAPEVACDGISSINGERVMRKSAVLLVGVLAIFIFLGVMMLQSLVIVQRIASVSEVVGDVYVKARADVDFSVLGQREHVLAGTTVKTGPASAVTLNWVDGSRVRLGPETTVRVRKCTMNTRTRATTSLFDLDVGRIWVRVLSVLGGQTKFEVHTPTATAGVRGTVFSVAVDPSGETRVAVYEGEVHVATEAAEATVSPGQQAAVGTDGRPEIARAPEDALNWQEQTGIIGPRLDLDVGPQVAVPAGATAVTISGVAEPGAQVSVNGTPVELDQRYRFTVEVPLGAATDGLIVVNAQDYRGATTVRAVALAQSQ